MQILTRRAGRWQYDPDAALADELDHSFAPNAGNRAGCRFVCCAGWRGRAVPAPPEGLVTTAEDDWQNCGAAYGGARELACPRVRPSVAAGAAPCVGQCVARAGR